MKFAVRRTSDLLSEKPPCEEAVLVERENDCFRWIRSIYEVELNTLDELIEFTKKHEGAVVLITDDGDRDKYYLEIYDDYRE